MKHTLIRIVVDLVLLAAIFIVPWWLWIMLCIVSAAFIDQHYEIVVIGFLADAASGSGGASGTQFFFFGSALVLVALSIILKPRLSFFAHR